MEEVTHGTISGYYHFNCRCDECRAAAVAYRRERRRDPAVRAGTHGYHGYQMGCRCDACRAANAARGRLIRERYRREGVYPWPAEAQRRKERSSG